MNKSTLGILTNSFLFLLKYDDIVMDCRYFDFIYADPCWDIESPKINTFMSTMCTSINNCLSIGGNFFIHVPFEHLFSLKQTLNSPGLMLKVDNDPTCLAQKQVSNRFFIFTQAFNFI